MITNDAMGKKKEVLLYGANGYTGNLIARLAAEYNITPILAGRNKAAILPLAEKLKLEYKIFDLNNEEALHAALQHAAVVIHAAGPFDVTAVQMIEACLKTHTHYLDLNGDAGVFETLFKYNEAAKSAGIMILSGAGFDVVPTDCIAMHLKNKLPGATHLQIAFATPGGAVSHGTAVTTLAKLGEAGAVRKGGKLMPVPIGHKSKRINFFAGKGKEEKNIFTMTIPWGDIFTAYISTGIPNIETFTAVPAMAYPFVKMQGLFNWLLRTDFIRNFIRTKIKSRPTGLNDEKRNAATSLVWGQATDSAGNIAEARLCGPDAYTLTAHSCLIIAHKILSQNFISGYQTPASAYGEKLVLEIPGVEPEY